MNLHDRSIRILRNPFDELLFLADTIVTPKEYQSLFLSR